MLNSLFTVITIITVVVCVVVIRNSLISAIMYCHRNNYKLVSLSVCFSVCACVYALVIGRNITVFTFRLEVRNSSNLNCASESLVCMR